MDADFEAILDPPYARLRVRGDLDLCARGDLVRALWRLRTSDCVCVCVDMAEVTFLDACSLGVFDRERRALTESGGGLELTGMSVRLERIARLAGYDQLLEPAPCLDSGHGRRR